MFKKSNLKSLIALFCLLLAIICIGTVTVFAYGAEDSEDADLDNDTGMPEAVCTNHVFFSECDPECDVCGTVRPVMGVSHTFDNDCDTDCNVCGYDRQASHRFDSSCDTDCNICGMIRTTEHVYDNDCDAICNECGSERAKELIKHSYSGDTDAECNICGAIRSVSQNNESSAGGCSVGTGMYITMLFAVMIPAMFVALTKKFI